MPKDLLRMAMVLWAVASPAIALTDDSAAVPEVVYIDPAPYLPAGMDQIVTEPLETVTLRELAKHLGERYGLETRLCEDDLSEEGVSVHDETSLPAGLPLYQALDVAIEDILGTPLTWVMEDGVIAITTETAAWDWHFTRVYEVSESLSGPDIQARLDLIRSFTNGDWISQGGHIDPADDLLVVTQTQAVHLEIDTLLEAFSRDGKFIRVEHPPHHQRLFEALDQVIEIEIDSQPLDEAVRSIGEQLDVPIRVHVSALKENGVEPSHPVDYHLAARPLRSVLNHILADVNGAELAYLIENGAICITSRDHVDDRFELALYDVADLLPATLMSELLQLINNQTSGRWYDDGGVVGEYGILPNGQMIVRQTAAVHEEIASLLSLIREMLVVQPAVETDPAAYEVRIYYLKSGMADQLEALLPELIAPGTWSAGGDRDRAWMSRLQISEHWGPTTNGRFGGQGGFGGQQGFFQVPIGTAEQLAAAWPAFQGFGMGAQVETPRSPCYEVALLIRQTHAVHEQIADFIDELNDPDHQSAPFGFGYQMGPGVDVVHFDAFVRSDVLSDPDWSPADRVDAWQTAATIPEQEYGYVDPANYLPDVLLRRLEQPLGTVPLADAAAAISAQFGIPVQIDAASLAEEGLEPTEVVTVPGDLPLHQALDRGLNDVAGLWLAWDFVDGVLVITTETAAADALRPHVYDVADLLAPGDDGEWLIELLENQTNGEWKRIDGIGGAADIIGNVLVVRQSGPMHREVGALLNGLRIDARTVRVGDPPEHAALYAALEQPVQVVFDAMPLDDAMEVLSEACGVPFQLLESDLSEEGITPDDEANYNNGERPLKSVLNVVLEEVGGTSLTYFIEDGAIQITTETAAADQFVVNIYQVSNILDAMPHVGGRYDYQALIDLVQNHTSGEWEDVDGIGGEQDALPGGRLAVRSTRANHEEIAQLFTALREHLPQRADEPFDPEAVETRYYHLQSTTADDLQRELPRLIAPESWRNDERPDAVGVILASQVTNATPLHYGGGGFFQMPDDATAEVEAGAEVAEPEPPPTTWLIITQTAGVHQRIAALLEEIATGQSASAPREASGWNRIDMQGLRSEVIGR